MHTPTLIAQEFVQKMLSTLWLIIIKTTLVIIVDVIVMDMHQGVGRLRKLLLVSAYITQKEQW